MNEGFSFTQQAKDVGAVARKVPDLFLGLVVLPHVLFAISVAITGVHLGETYFSHDPEDIAFNVAGVAVTGATFLGYVGLGFIFMRILSDYQMTKRTRG